MFRTHASAIAILILTGLIGVGQDAAKPAKKAGDEGQKATITSIDAKSGIVTVRMKDKSGKEVDRKFQLAGEVRYLDSTGNVAAADIFQNGDDVLIIEAEGRLREMHQRGFDLGKNDHRFFHAAAEINMTEMKLGKLAQEHGSAAAIKKFGERTLADHAQMNKELRNIAKAQDMTLVDTLDKHHQHLLDHLSKLNGADFDREYARDMVKGHRQAIMRFEAEAKHGQNSQLKAWAEKWLPTLREHLKLAQAAAADVGVSSK